MSAEPTSPGLAERMQPSIGARLRAIVLHCLPLADTQDIAAALRAETQPFYLGGSLEIVDDRQCSLHVSWKQVGADFGLFGSAEPWRDDLTCDQLVATNYAPWRAVIGSRLARAQSYAFPETAAFANALELTLEAASDRFALWLWTGAGAKALAVDDVSIGLDVKPSNLADMQVLGTVQ